MLTNDVKIASTYMKNEPWGLTTKTMFTNIPQKPKNVHDMIPELFPKTHYNENKTYKVLQKQSQKRGLKKATLKSPKGNSAAPWLPSGVLVKPHILRKA